MHLNAFSSRTLWNTSLTFVKFGMSFKSCHYTKLLWFCYTDLKPSVCVLHAWKVEFRGWGRSWLSSPRKDITTLDMMGPRRKSTKTQNLDEGLHDSLSQEEPKDYMNELSHEVLCHIFRSVAKPLTSSIVWPHLGTCSLIVKEHITAWNENVLADFSQLVTALVLLIV